MYIIKKYILTLIIVLVFVFYGTNVFAQNIQTNKNSLYVPLIGISSVPDPLALPDGPGNVTYHYAVKNFLNEYALTNVEVVDDKCSPINFVEGDDNGDGKLDSGETWRYVCTTKLHETTQSIATVTGTANNLLAEHKAYATVVVGSKNAPPLVNIINVTKVAYPLSLPAEGGDITFTYRVNNPGVVPLSNVSVTDEKCSSMSSRLGDTNGNNLLDLNEVWVYTCTTHLVRTTTNTVNVVAFANGLKAVGYATITVTVDQSLPGLPETGSSVSLKFVIWGVLGGILLVLIVIFYMVQKNKTNKKKLR